MFGHKKYPEEWSAADIREDIELAMQHSSETVTHYPEHALDIAADKLMARMPDRSRE